MGNLAFFYDTFFFPRDEAGPRGPCTLHTECDNLLPSPKPFATQHTIHNHPPSPSLSLFLYCSLSAFLLVFSIFQRSPLPALYPYEYVYYYVAPRPPDARKKFGPACGRARDRHVLSPWINVSRASFDLDSLRTGGHCSACLLVLLS